MEEMEEASIRVNRRVEQSVVSDVHLREARSAWPVEQQQGAGALFADNGYFGLLQVGIAGRKGRPTRPNRSWKRRLDSKPSMPGSMCRYISQWECSS